MKIHQCDRCHDVIEEGDPSVFDLEIDETASDRPGAKLAYQIGLAVTKAHQKGGRVENADLCRECWGFVLHAAVDAAFPIAKEAKDAEAGS